MINVPITLKENSSITKTEEPISVSIPFENGKIYHTDTLALINNKHQLINQQISILAYWPDKSLKWIRISFQFSSTTNETNVVYLTDSSDFLTPCEIQKCNYVTVHEASEYYEVSTGVAIFQVNKNELGVFSANTSILENTVHPIHKSKSNSLVLTDNDGIEYYPTIENIHFSSEDLIHRKLLQLTAYISGFVQAKDKKSVVKFSAEITFYANKATTKWQFTLHNPNPMIHSGGTWDLGNENSLYFKSLNAYISCKNKAKYIYKITVDNNNDEDNNWQESCNKLLIFQASSGGENWQSNNHVNSQGIVPIEFNGYQISSETSKDVRKEVTEGRATPFIFIEQDNINGFGATIHVKDFWQKFPKSIEVNASNIILGLFPDQATDGFELQPGEKKSDTFYISYDNDKNSLLHFESPVHVSIPSEYLAKTKTVPFFSSNNDETDYNNIINDGLLSSNNFFQKRELIDEFGWRNFGDLYADHETLETDCDGELISHYNNQYDPLYGLLRQYLLTNDLKWLVLANDLAEHVKNIDIYHTCLDRAEYNGGLFWHTDHYLPAETASHRTYSKRQKSNAYQDHAGGGGPGGQHCYTSGLMLHYLLTGEETSKQAVLQLTNWITCVYEGSGTLTDFLLAIKNKNRLDVKNIFTGKYPLDRGTGHYIFALIDSFEITGKQSYLDQASLIIKSTVHPEDNIDDRNLDNVEDSWFYTIFLQAVYRYLLIKQNSKQLDASFHYARASLQHYAIWMCEHEQPYLDKPEILEYPNHTWAAQDIRKANVLYMASYFANNQEIQSQCKVKANEIYAYVTQTFSKEPTRNFTRILSILMQNHGIKSYIDNAEDLFFPQKPTLYNPYGHLIKNEKQNFNVNKHLLSAFFTTLSNTSLSHELSWLRKRSKNIDQFFTKLGK